MSCSIAVLLHSGALVQLVITYIVFDCDDALLKIVHGHLVVLHHGRYLQLLDAVPDGQESRGAPQESVHLDGAHLSLHLSHVRLVVPGLDVENDIRFGDDLRF